MFKGVVGIVAGVTGMSVIITFVTETWDHWPFVIAGIIFGLFAVQSVNK